MLAACLTAFWSFLAGGRLVAQAVAASRLRLPHALRHAIATGVAMMALAVLPPAAVLALASGGGFAMAASILAIGVATGLLWASMPPWTMLPMINLGLFARWLPEPIAAALAELLRSPAGLGMVALGILLACPFAGCGCHAIPKADRPGRSRSRCNSAAALLSPRTPASRPAP